MAARSFLDLWIPGAGEPVAPATGGFTSWLQLSGVWISGSGVVAPTGLEAPSAGVQVVPIRIVGRGRLVAAPAQVRAVGTVRIRGRARVVAKPATVRATGRVRLRATVRIQASAAAARGFGAVANPGQWVIVVEDESGEEVLVVASGGST